MALKNTVDAASATASLQTWLAERTGGEDVVVTDVETPAASGMSNETVLFTAAWTTDGERRGGRFVARIQPPDGAGVFRTYDLKREVSVLRALATDSAVPVPAVLFSESDPRVLGAPFFVMERIDGRVPADDPPYTVAGWYTELTAEERRRLHGNAFAAMAAVHAVDWQAAGLGDLDRRDLGADPLRQQLAQWRAYIEWAAAGRPTPVIDAALEWLDEHAPAPGPTVLIWGDARIGNILFGPDQSVEGVLDWEMVGVGHPDLDVAWDLFVLEHNTAGIGVPMPDGAPTVQEAAALYSSSGGRELPHLAYYRVFSAMRLSCFMVRAAALMIAAGILPPDTPLPDNNPAVALLASALGLQPLAGASASYFGAR